LAWLRKIPAWAWIVVIAAGLVVTTVIGWRRAAVRLGAALERARSAERGLDIEREASYEHAKVAKGLELDLAKIDEQAEGRLEELEGRAQDVKRASDDAGSLADLANDHFGNR
jgi:hypothetical protein